MSFNHLIFLSILELPEDLWKQYKRHRSASLNKKKLIKKLVKLICNEDIKKLILTFDHLSKHAKQNWCKHLSVKLLLSQSDRQIAQFGGGLFDNASFALSGFGSRFCGVEGVHDETSVSILCSFSRSCFNYEINSIFFWH